MNWIDGLEAALADSPLLAVVVGSLVCLALLVLIGGMAGAPFPWPRRRKEINPDWQETQPADIQWSTPTMRRWPLAIREAEPLVIKNLGNTPLYVDMTPPPPIGSRVSLPMPPKRITKLEPGESVVVPQGKDCCGKCDGSRCGDKPSPSASTMTPQELRTALARTAAASPRRTGQVPPRRNPGPGHVPPRAWPAPASSASASRRRDDSSDAGVPFLGSRAIDSDPPAPAPKVAPFVSGLGGDFGGAGASGSWAAPAPDTCRAPAPSPSYDSGYSSSSSSSSSSDCGGGDSGGGGGGGD